MSILESIKNFFSKQTGSFNSVELFKQADAVAESLQIVLDATTVEVFRHDLSIIFAVVDTNHTRRLFMSAASYDYVCEHISNQWERIRRKDVLAPLVAVIGTVALDLRDITSNYGHFFEGDDIDPENLKLSNLLIAGYIEKAQLLSDWIMGIIFIHNKYTAQGKPVYPNDPYNPAKYLTTRIQNTAPYVQEMFTEILSRKKTDTLLTLLRKLNERGSDVKVKSGGLDITSYAEDKSFTPVELSYTRIGMLNPLMSFAKWRAVRARSLYERNKELREYIKIRIAFLEQEQAGLSKDDPQYLHYEKVCKNYLDRISVLDKEIAKYEI